MKILILDTETNGLPSDWGAKPEQFHLFPEILSVAWIMWNTETGEAEENYYILNREIKEWDKYAKEVNGFTQEKLDASDNDPANVLGLWLMEDMGKCNLIVCHNTGFDIPIIEADLHRVGLPITRIRNTYCTMKSTTELCRIPNPRGRGYKWPKLPELYKFLFNRDMEQDYEAHNALEDTKCTFECLKELVKMGWTDFDEILGKNIYL